MQQIYLSLLLDAHAIKKPQIRHPLSQLTPASAFGPHKNKISKRQMAIGIFQPYSPTFAALKNFTST
ncbi:MAG: hypothetical protein EAY75_15225 [Bacteroidetes bacterium]|nr:MAG: hypothetical protein EAY75_15225 [Bacteroidota bacterium]